MKVVPFHPEYFETIKKHLKNQLPVILPTDTCYGFSGLISSSYAIKTVERIKGRENKPFLILVENQTQMEKLGSSKNINFENILENTNEPTTFLLQKTEEIPQNYFSEFTEIGIRIPSSFRPLLGFLHFLQTPIFSTSANFSGQPSLYAEHDVIRQFSQFPEILFASAGTLPYKPSSNIIRYDEEGNFEKIR